MVPPNGSSVLAQRVERGTGTSKRDVKVTSIGVPHPATGIESHGASSASCWAMTSCRPPRSREPGRRPDTTTRRPGRCWSAPGSPPIAARVPGRADPTRSLGTPTWRTRPRGARCRALPARTNRPGAGASPGQAQKLLPRPRIVTDDPLERRRHGSRPVDLGAPQGHTEMFCFQHNSNTFRFESRLEALGNLGCQSLLELEVARKELYDAGELGEADYALGWEVPDVSNPMKRQQVVHAQRLERDVAHHDELVVSLIIGKARQAERLGSQHVAEGGGHASRGVSQPG